MVTSIKFALYESRKELWRQVVQPLIAGCAGHEKVTERRWRRVRKNVSFILAESRLSDGTEALLSFWGEPFMAETSGRQAPRFIFQSRSTLSIFRVLWNWSAAAYMHRPPTNKRRSYG
jgi:hypothetical protein